MGKLDDLTVYVEGKQIDGIKGFDYELSFIEKIRISEFYLIKNNHIPVIEVVISADKYEELKSNHEKYISVIDDGVSYTINGLRVLISKELKGDEFRLITELQKFNY